MRILIVGCGSIGRRHARNARALGAEVVLCDINESRMREFGEAIGASGYFTDFEKASASSGVDAAVVATPSNIHVAPAFALLSAGVHVLMEKPLCTSVAEATELRALVKETDLVFMMAHTFRFRAEWKAVKNLLDTNPLGKIFSVESMGGWYLPDWHVREDYRYEYAAQKRLGGGVVLTALSHFFDVIAWFFGDIERIAGARMHLGDLELDVDDSAVCVLLTSLGVAVTLAEDFLSRCPRRLLRINAEYGYLEVDFNRKILGMWDARKKRFHPDNPAASSPGEPRFRILEDGVAYDPNPDILPMSYSGNDAYLAELKYFFELIATRKTVFDLDIDAGIKALEAMLHAGIEDWTLYKVGN